MIRENHILIFDKCDCCYFFRHLFCKFDTHEMIIFYCVKNWLCFEKSNWRGRGRRGVWDEFKRGFVEQFPLAHPTLHRRDQRLYYIQIYFINSTLNCNGSTFVPSRRTTRMYYSQCFNAKTRQIVEKIPCRILIEYIIYISFLFENSRRSSSVIYRSLAAQNAKWQ